MEWYRRVPSVLFRMLWLLVGAVLRLYFPLALVRLASHLPFGIQHLQTGQQLQTVPLQNGPVNLGIQLYQTGQQLQTVSLPIRPVDCHLPLETQLRQTVFLPTVFL